MLFKEPKFAWLLLAVLWCFTFAGSLGRIVIAFFQPEITADLGVERDFLGFTWSTAIVLTAVCAPLGGLLADRKGYAAAMGISAAMNALGAASVLFIPSTLGYWLGNGLLAGLSGLGAASAYMLVQDWFRHHRAKALALLGSAGSLGLAVLTPLLTQGHKYEWRQLYAVLLVVHLLFLPLAALVFRSRAGGRHEDTGNVPLSENQELSAAPETILPPKDGQKPLSAAPSGHSGASPANPPQSWREKSAALLDMARNRVFLVVSFSLLACGFSMGTVEMNLAAIHQHSHVPTATIAASLSLLGVLEVCGGLLFSYFLDRSSRSSALALLFGVRVLAFSLLLPHLQLSPVFFSLLFGASYVGAVSGGILLADENAGGPGGLRTGFLLLLHQLGGAAAALGGGILYRLQHSYQTVIAVNLILSALAFVFFLLLSRHLAARRRPSRGSSAELEASG